MQVTIDNVLNDIEKIPTLNAIAFEVIQLCSDQEIAIPKLVKVISMDQSLSSQILKVANSSYFNFPRTIYSLDRAIVILGFNLLRDIAISLSVYSVFKGFSHDGGIDFQKLWQHSLYSGMIMKVLADNYDPDSKDKLYMSGLLHDFGKLAMASSLKKDYAFLHEKSETEGASLFFLEKKFFGFTHADVGAKLLDIWNLPEEIVTLVKFHHCPDDYDGADNHSALVRLTYLGNMLANLSGMEEQNLETLVKMDPNFMTFFSFTDIEIAQMMDSISNDIEENRKYINLFEAGTV